MKKRVVLFSVLIVFLFFMLLIQIANSQNQGLTSEEQKIIEAQLQLMQGKADYSLLNDLINGKGVSSKVLDYILINYLDKLYPSLLKSKPSDLDFLLSKSSFIEGYKKLSDQKKIELVLARDDKGEILFKTERLNKILPDFIESFKKISSDKKAEYFLNKDSKNNPLMDDNLKNQVWNSFDKATKDSTLLGISNKVLSDLYSKDEKFKDNQPRLEKVNIADKSKLKWEGNKLIGEKGGYIDFDDKGEKRLHPGMKELSYENSKFTGLFPNGRTLVFSEGTIGWKWEETKEGAEPSRDTYFIGKDGKRVGGNKGLQIGGINLEISSKNGEKSVIELNYNEKGETQILLYGNIMGTYLIGKDQNNNPYYLGINPEIFGERSDKYKSGDLKVETSEKEAISIKIDKDNILLVKNADIQTSGMGRFKTSNGEETALIGNYFNEPGIGIPSILGTAFSAVKSEVWGKLSEMAQNLLQDTVQKTSNLLVKLNSPLQTAFDLATAEKNVISGENLGTYVIPVLTKDEIEKRVIDKLAHPEYENFDYKGSNYIYVNNVKNELSPQAMKSKGEEIPWIVEKIGGSGIDVDLSSAYRSIDRLYASNNFGDKPITVHDGPSIITFEREKTYFNTVSLDRGLYENLEAVKPIDRIINTQDKSGPMWKIANSEQENKMYLYSIDRLQEGVIQSASQFISGSSSSGIKGRLIAKGVGLIYGGGMQITNAPLDEGTYPGDLNDPRVDIVTDPQRISYGGRRPGIAGRIADKMLEQQRASISVSTEMVSSQMSSTFEDTLNGMVESMGGESQFLTSMDYLGKMKATGVNLEQSLPGYSKLIDDFYYVYQNPEKFDETMNAISGAGQMSPGVPFTMTMNEGAFLGGEKIQGADPQVIRLIASSAIMNPQPATYSTPEEMQSKQGEGIKPTQSIVNYFNEMKSRVKDKKVAVMTPSS